MRIIQALVCHLLEHKQEIVRNVDVLAENWDPTYGLQEPRSTTIEIVDFDALLSAMDHFAGTFK